MLFRSRSRASFFPWANRMILFGWRTSRRQRDLFADMQITLMVRKKISDGVGNGAALQEVAAEIHRDPKTVERIFYRTIKMFGS